MQHQFFKIEFFSGQNLEEQQKQTELYKYRAVITLISKNFKVFKVTEIQRIEKNNVIKLKAKYVVTSYPFESNSESKWKDALTFQSGKFIELVGGAIEEYIEQASSTYHLN